MYTNIKLGENGEAEEDSLLSNLPVPFQGDGQ